MRLIIIAACFAACYAAKLDRSYLPPESAKTAGGTSDILQTPFRSAGENLPQGSFINEFEGVVIDAAAATAVDTRVTGQSGLGASRISYGSTDSKVGEAAFRDTTNLNQNNQTTSPGNLPNVHGFRQPVILPGDQAMPVLEAERFHAARDRASNIIAYQNDIGTKDFNYAYQTDNGISVGEIGIAVNGVRSQGGYSYTGDDGQVYTVSYTADEGGYRPQGAHLPTPPPIPVEILKALEQNAKDEAAGILDDGSYDALKYNTEDSTKGNSYNEQSVNGAGFNGIIDSQNKQSNQQNHQQNNGLQSNHFTTNYEYTDEKQIDSISNQYNNFNSNTQAHNFEDSNSAQANVQFVNKQFNVPLSQQNLQKQKENGDTPGRPSSYEAPISGFIQGTLNDKVKVFSNNFENKGMGNEQSQQNFNSGSVSQFLNTNTQSELVDTVHSQLINQFPSVTANSNFGNFGYRPLQPTNVFQAPTGNLFGQTNINKEENKITSSTLAPQQTDRFHANTFNPFFLHKQFALKNQQQKNQQALSSVFNSVNANKTSNVFPIQANKDNQYFQLPTTLKPFDFSNQNQNSASQLLNPAYLPPNSFSFSSASQVNPGQVSQSTFSATGASTHSKPPTAVPSKLLTTPKEDMPEVSQGSSGLTQASISSFPQTSNFNKPSNFVSSPQNSFPTQVAVGSSFNQANFQSQNFGQAPLGANGFQKTPDQIMNTQNLGEVYEYQKPVQSLPVPSEKPSTFSQIQNNDETYQTATQNNFNQKQEATYSITSNKSEDSYANFAPKLLPSRPQFPKTSCCSANPNKKDSIDNQSNHNSGNNADAAKAQSFTSNTQSFSRKDNFRGTQTQAFDETGYHY